MVLYYPFVKHTLGITGFQLWIFILVDNSLKWTYFGPTIFIHQWITLAHATLHVSDVTDNWSSWLVDVTFIWRHVMVTAVERNNQTCRLLTFLRRLFCINLIKTSQILNKNDVKTKYKCKRWIPWKHERNRSRSKLTCRASLTLHLTHCVHLRNKFHFSEVHGSMNATSHVQSLCFYIVFVHYLWIFVLKLANKRRRKVIIWRVWLLRSTAVIMTWRQSNVTSANQLLHLSMTSLTRNVAWTDVVHGCMNLVGPK